MIFAQLILTVFLHGSRMAADEDLFQWVTEGALLGAVGVVGLLGNCCSVLVFARQRIQRVFHHLLLALAIFDAVGQY